MHSALSTLAASPRLSRLAAARVPLLLLYGVIAFAFAIVHFDSALPDDVRLMQSRSNDLSRSIAVVERGGPPLLGCDRTYLGDVEAPGQRCLASGIGDDQGLYLYVPLVGQLFGETDPFLLLKWMFTWVMAFAVLLYPLIFGTLFRSIPVGLLAPLPLLFGFDFLQNTDIYWIVGWAALLGLPLVLLALDRDRWDRHATALLVSAVAVGGFATSIRSQAGLPILIAAAIVALIRGGRWRNRALTLGVVTAAYLVFSSVPLLIAREYRDHSTGVNYSAGAPTSHAFWHPIYLGLGYLENPYGIKWDDSVALAAVVRERPGTVYLSHEYEQTLKGLYLDILREDPGFVAKTYAVKFREVLRQARDEFGLALLLIPALLLTGQELRRRRLFTALAVPALAITVLPPVLTRPEPDYGFQVGFLSVVGLLCLLGAAFGVVAAQRAALAVGDIDRETFGARWSDARGRLATATGRGVDLLERRRVALIAAGVAVGFVAIVLALRSGDEAPRVDYEASATPLVRSTGLEGTPVKSWDFRGALPAGWEPLPGVSVEPSAAGTDVITTVGTSEYQLVSDALALEAGRYRIDLKGDVRAGGLELGALDTTTNTWIALAHYWSGQSGFASSLMTLPLTLAKPAKVQLVLSNWNARRTSTWRIDDLRLVRP